MVIRLPRRLYFAICIACLLAVIAAVGGFRALASDKVPAPITETKRLQLTNQIQKIQILQLQIHAAQQELAREKATAEQLIKEVTIEGWDLDLESGIYRKPTEKK